MKTRDKLKKVLNIINSYINKQKQKNWITPEDKRYIKIIKKYEPKLSKLWQKTRDSYLKKFIEKDLSDFNNNPEQYEDPSFDSSNYIDEALSVLAFAFGEAVLVGYNEIIARDITVEIPEYPKNIFDEAKEIKNYEWAALSYEQKQMNEIFDEYNRTIDGKKQISQWFDDNQYRLTDLILGGLVWYGIQFGFMRALIETQSTTQGRNLLAYWITERDGKVCQDCQALEDKNPYSDDNPLPTLPGGGKTICGSKCRCLVDFKEI